MRRSWRRCERGSIRGSAAPVEPRPAAPSALHSLAGGQLERSEEVSVKRFLTLASVLVAALAASAALAAPSAAPTRTSGTLVVGFGDPAVGFAVGTVRGSTIKNPKGYEVDLATAIAKRLGIAKIDYIYTPWTK